MKEVALHIKNMVCPRCIKVVADELKALGIQVQSVELGKAVYIESAEVDRKAIESAIEKEGFEIIKSNEDETLEQIKIAIIRFVREPGQINQDVNFSDYISESCGKPYAYLSKLFSQKKEITIEKYFILQRIEYAKELIEYGNFTFSEIAYKLGYKSPQHLSSQFKAITGMLMKEYKSRIDKSGRITIDKI